MSKLKKKNDYHGYYVYIHAHNNYFRNVQQLWSIETYLHGNIECKIPHIIVVYEWKPHASRCTAGRYVGEGGCHKKVEILEVQQCTNDSFNPLCKRNYLLNTNEETHNLSYKLLPFGSFDAFIPLKRTQSEAKRDGPFYTSE